MKMKKLTALALAGVLCLGMSTTAFAAGSVDQGTADKNKSDVVETEGVKGSSQSSVTTDNGNVLFNKKDWDNEKLSPEKRSEKIVKSFEKELKSITDKLDDQDIVDGMTTKQYEQLKARQDVLEELANADALYEVVDVVDLAVDGIDNPTADDPITVRFNLNGKFEDIAEGQTIRMLHMSEANGNVWEIYETVVKHDHNGYYAEWDFEHFSPVAIMRVTDNGEPVVDPVEPQDPTEPTEPTNPNGTGSLTADQLADLIAQRLQQNARTAAASVVRTAGKPSPKTGE